MLVLEINLGSNSASASNIVNLDFLSLYVLIGTRLTASKNHKNYIR